MRGSRGPGAVLVSEGVGWNNEFGMPLGRIVQAGMMAGGKMEAIKPVFGNVDADDVGGHFVLHSSSLSSL